MYTIKFSHRYEKMPKHLEYRTMLMQTFIIDNKDMSELFYKYDTLYYDDEAGAGFFPLPSGKLIVLLLITYNHVWTTVRRWTPDKEIFYKSITGQDVGIFIREEPHAVQE